MDTWFELSSGFGRLAIALALCADACSVAMILGMNAVGWKRSLGFSSWLGIFHGILPIIGTRIGQWSGFLFGWYAPLVSSLILTILGIQLLWTAISPETTGFKIDNLFKMIFVAFLVSIDAWTIGFTFGTVGKWPISDCIWLALISFVFSWFAWWLGKTIRYKGGRFSSVFGGTIFLVFGIKGVLEWN